MTKKLEPGCKAVTVNCLVPENNGKVVTLIKFVGKVKGWKGDRRWLTDTCVYIDTDGEMGYAIKESCLRRIDDDQETTTWEAMRDIWVPDQLKERELSRD